MYGEGQRTRRFCHVADVVPAPVALMDRRAAVGGVYNVGSEEEVSINDPARRVIELAGSDTLVGHVSYEQACGRSFDDVLAPGRRSGSPRGTT